MRLLPSTCVRVVDINWVLRFSRTIIMMMVLLLLSISLEIKKEW